MSSIVDLGREATLEDLWNVDGPAELIDGEIVPVTPIGFRPGRAAFRICRSLDEYEARHGGGLVVSDPVGFILQTPRTQVLIPDASWWVGKPDETEEAEILPSAPAFAAEVRSKTGYGPLAEREMAHKRALYFAGGTKVVWDVDVLREKVIRVYRADDPGHPTIFRRGDIVDAEPAVPGWRFPVDDLFR